MAGIQQQTWICDVCGYEHDGDHPPGECPVGGVGPEQLSLKEPTGGEATEAKVEVKGQPLDDYLKEWARDKDGFESRYARIAQLAKTGASSSSPMRTQRKFPDWESVLFRGAQLDPMPLNGDVPVSTRTVIGPGAKHPLEMKLPFYVSHMSYGALSREAKIALARGAKEAGVVACSGEGGMLPDEKAAAGLYIYELGTADFSHREDNIKVADAIEIKIGQAAKPGLGGTLPKTKITEEIASIRGIPQDKDSHSPGRHTGINSPEDLKRRVAELREMTGGRPIGVKFTAGRIEADLAVAVAAEPDFITIDCRGGGTGSGPDFVKDNVCLPPVFALHRARRFLDQHGGNISLCITGGFRDSTDIAKALAMGADAVALATASMIAVGCQQYRICDSGRCPVGIATQDPELRKRFDIDLSVQRYVNFAGGMGRELEVLSRINGHDNVHALNVGDLMTLEHEISLYTNIEHA
jgi:glutamate synthase domain-containing protein 2